MHACTGPALIPALSFLWSINMCLIPMNISLSRESCDLKMNNEECQNELYVFLWVLFYILRIDLMEIKGHSTHEKKSGGNSYQAISILFFDDCHSK